MRTAGYPNRSTQPGNTYRTEAPVKRIKLHYPKGNDWIDNPLSPGDLLKYRLVTGVYYSGIFLGLTPVSHYQVMRFDILVNGMKQSINTNTIIELEVLQ